MHITRDQALDLLHSKLENPNLRRHSYSVEAAMRALARHFNENEEVWEIVGLLHDGDYEQTKTDIANHSKLMAQWVKDLGETDEALLSGIISHGLQQPTNQMEWSLFCCDELTGLIVATTLVQPEKKLASVTVEAVLKKFRISSFAAGAKREDIIQCETLLNIPLNDFISIVLDGMKIISSEIGL